MQTTAFIADEATLFNGETQAVLVKNILEMLDILSGLTYVLINVRVDMKFLPLERISWVCL